MTIEQTETQGPYWKHQVLSKVFASRSFLGRTVSETKAVDQVSLSLSAEASHAVGNGIEEI